MITGALAGVTPGIVSQLPGRKSDLSHYGTTGSGVFDRDAALMLVTRDAASGWLGQVAHGAQGLLSPLWHHPCGNHAV
jgi:hypothetical protein